MGMNLDRCDLKWNDRFTTDKGVFLVTGIHFTKNQKRTGLYVIKEELADKGESFFISEKELIQMEKEEKFTIT